MFVRKKRNRSGSTSVIIVDKSRGRFRELKTIGVSSDEKELAALYQKGKLWIFSHCGVQDMFAMIECEEEEKQVIAHLLSNVENILLNGSQLILNQVFELVGFDAIEDVIFKQLVVSRLCHPQSKAATVEYLKSHFNEDVELHRIYRYLDKLHNTQQETVQRISVEHTRKVLGGRIGVVFYDVSTLYFETDYEDNLRAKGFSKDGKHAQPQIVLGLLVSAGGYPLSYSLFNGSQYEGRTMLPIVEDFVQRFDLDDFVVVADSGLMNSKNIAMLDAGGYKYIIGGRIKNESEDVKQWILSLDKMDGSFYELGKLPKTRLIIGYSDKRAKKDKYNREKGIRRLQKEFGKGNITKDQINKRGYNKFLELSRNDIIITINKDKINEDEQWDGLKGYITNTGLPAKVVYEQYRELWQVERAYRITKGTLELRPMFHFTEKRIEAHVCICFVAYKVYKELERVLRASAINLSVDKVLDIAKTITTIKIKLPGSGKTMTKTMLLTPEHKLIAQLFDENFWKTF